VLEAADGSQALDRARLLRPDLIITDLMMPQMDGFELAEALQRDERTRKIPLIFISCQAEETSVARARGIGALAYLTKSADPDATTTLIVDLLAQKRRTDRFLAEVLEGRQKHTAFVESDAGSRANSRCSPHPEPISRNAMRSD
jgi:CheY-like chemotaxis protein